MKNSLTHQSSCSKLYLLLPFFFFFCTTVSAQQATIAGKVLETADKPLGYANVLLLKAADSSLVKGTLSDESGAFLFEGIAVGRYKVVASMVGLGKSKAMEANVTSEAEALKLSPILMSQSATALKEVVIEAQKPFIEQHLDKTVLNVENSIVSAGNTALEVLEKAPGVVIDQNDNISMRGRQGVIVMVDGKPVPMSGSELANMLRGMSANSVEKIELITNPSAKYDAAGNSGIIDIRLKRDKSLGTNGTFSASYGQGRFAKSNQGVQLNHRTKKFNFFGSYNYVLRKDYNDLDIYRRFLDENGAFIGAYDQQNRFDFTMNNHSGRVGADYFLSPKTVLGVVASGFASDLDRGTNNRSAVINAAGQTESSFVTGADVEHGRRNQAYNFNLKHTLDSLGREISADLDYIAYRNTDEQNFTTNYYNLSNEQIRDPYLLYGTLDGELTIRSARADYRQPLRAIGGNFEAGLKSSLVKADNDLAFFDRSNGGNVPDTDKSNHFLYDENINAAYVNANKKWSKTGLQLGLRLENTIAKGRQLTDGQKFDRNYTQLFPSAAVNYSLNKKHDLGVSVSRRINRPSYNQLNPFKNFLDPSTYAAGNPFLKPELSYSFELTHTFDQRFITKLSYSRTTDVMVQVLSPAEEGEKLVVQTFRNLASLDYYGLTLTAPFSIGNWFNSVNNATFYYGHYKGYVADTDLSNGIPTFNLNSNNTIKLPNDWSAELVGVYRSREVYGFLEVDPLWFMSMGVQKQFWDRKASVKLNVSDVFFTNKVNGYTALARYEENFFQRRDTQVATLSFNYRFGQAQSGPSRRRTGSAEEETRRAN
ncbi:outer membrane beta-barrel family protein [Pontibacter ramchanderi]|uniref:Outer membrane receptor protein involved in Fe transport n=1 Tax=Pontibacter ramchanderi TaxID=1179743 RepID=A0A2N3V367_9BACT|nr:outer membrane beta-barrel family protein [Pontibacter ramchanderi]PKV76085.1 outer membrane receptor protein involved in Fe transport [Pontibacter ramchanderi]